MSANTIDVSLLKKMFLSGAKNLELNKEYINELNVFPVPDGDTGTNMTMTIMSAANDVVNLEDPDMVTLCKSISSGSLRGARGNSGVILSQLLRGFTKVAKEYDTLDVAILSAACDKAVETAYKAVMKPKEGTILTVARGIAEKAAELFENGEEDIDSFYKAVLEHGRKVLDSTPDLLPVLKEAGVVDSGGEGLMTFLQGAYDAFCGKEIEFSMDTDTKKQAGSTRKLSNEQPVATEEEIKFGYCTEFIILLEGKVFNIQMENDFKDFLESIGDSIVCVPDEELVKVHVHTNDPGLAIQRALKYGQLSNLKIDNMRLEHHEKVVKMNEKAEAETKAEAPKAAPAEMKDTGFISVCAGAGFAEIFKNLGADYVIEGGQTMNPSTEDILNAISQINAKTIYVLPNNGNIIMAANQARDLTEDKEIVVIPTKTVPQGITALISFVPDMSAKENEEAMTEAIGLVKTGQITYAVRDTNIDGHEVHKDDYMGLSEKSIISNGKDLETVFLETVKGMADDDTEIISIYYGSDVSEADAEALKNKLAEAYPACDIDLQNGGQPVYYYVISAE